MATDAAGQLQQRMGMSELMLICDSCGAAYNGAYPCVVCGAHHQDPTKVAYVSHFWGAHTTNSCLGNRVSIRGHSFSTDDPMILAVIRSGAHTAIVTENNLTTNSIEQQNTGPVVNLHFTTLYKSRRALYVTKDTCMYSTVSTCPQVGRNHRGAWSQDNKHSNALFWRDHGTTAKAPYHDGLLALLAHVNPPEYVRRSAVHGIKPWPLFPKYAPPIPSSSKVATLDPSLDELLPQHYGHYVMMWMAGLCLDLDEADAFRDMYVTDVVYSSDTLRDVTVLHAVSIGYVIYVLVCGRHHSVPGDADSAYAIPSRLPMFLSIRYASPEQAVFVETLLVPVSQVH